VWSFLLFTGYLKATSYELDQGSFEFVATLSIPNLEVEFLFKSIIKWWLKQALGNNSLALFHSLTAGDILPFISQFQDYVANSLSIFDLADKQPERIYHAFVLGLLVQLNATHEVKSNRESGFGRYDVLLIPRDSMQLGVIIEFKRVFPEHGETLDSACQAALQQIEEKNYAQEPAIPAGAYPWALRKRASRSFDSSSVATATNSSPTKRSAHFLRAQG